MCRLKMWESIIQNRDTSLLAHFFVITYSDLKKYKYYYWFTFPAFVAKPAWEIGEQGWRPATVKFSAASVSPCVFIRSSASAQL